MAHPNAGEVGNRFSCPHRAARGRSVCAPSRAGCHRRHRCLAGDHLLCLVVCLERTRLVQLVDPRCDPDAIGPGLVRWLTIPARVTTA